MYTVTEVHTPMLKRITLAMLATSAIATVLTAADFWLKKPFTEWTDEESHKMVTGSPWAWQKSFDTQGGNGPVQTVTGLWQSALPVKRAMFGKSSLTNPQAKALLDRVENVYLLRVQGVPGSYREKADVEKITMATTLKIKGRDNIHPTEVQIPQPVAPKGFAPKGGAPKANNFQNNFQGKGGRGGGGGDMAPAAPGGFGGGGFTPSFDVYFVFPRSIELKVEDNEMEFDTNIGGLSLRHKFKLKEMVYDGKLEI